MQSQDIQPSENEFKNVKISRKLAPNFEFVHLPQEKAFPLNIFSFRKYSGLKVLALFFLLWSSLSFIHTLYLAVFHPDSFVRTAAVQIENRGIIKKIGLWFYHVFWQDTPTSVQVADKASTLITHQILWGLLRISICWCFVWGCFDWRNARYLLFAIFSFGFGVLYNFTPGHMIDNEIPIVGETETTTVDTIAAGLGLAAIAEHLKKRSFER
jgi:hypothetical protein